VKLQSGLLNYNPLRLAIFLAVMLFLLGHPAELRDKVIISLLNRGAAIRFVCLFSLFIVNVIINIGWKTGEPRMGNKK
jgi:hypothetical protein